MEPKQPKSFFNYFGLIFIVIFLVALCLVLILRKDKTNKNTSFNQKTSIGTNEKCPPLFSYEFTDYSKIDGFQPIGSISGASKGRSYITISKGQTVPVYLPLDAKLVSIIYAYRGPDAPAPEYGFKFDLGCGVTLLFDHLDSTTDDLKKYAPKEASRSTATNDNLSVPIKGGTLLGTTDGTPNARTFDFLVLDKNANIDYIKPERWQWEQSKYSVCPYDYYAEELKQKYYAKIGESHDDGLKKSLDCGHVSYDIDNTISGGWFDNAATDVKGKFLFIGERLGKVELTVKSDSEGTLLRVSDYSPKVLPKDVGIGESACYTGFANDWVYVELSDGNSIRLNNGSGKCPSVFPENGAQIFQR